MEDYNFHEVGIEDKDRHGWRRMMATAASVPSARFSCIGSFIMCRWRRLQVAWFFAACTRP